MSQPVSDDRSNVLLAQVSPDQGGSTFHRAARVRRLKLAFGTAILTRPLALLIPVICLPLFIRYLGAERYGLYESVGAFAVWLTLTNAGLVLGLQNRLQDTCVSGDRTLARRYISSLTLALGTGVLVAIILLSLITPLVDWQAVFPTTTASPSIARETAWSVWVTGVITLVGIAAGIPAVAYTAYQEMHVLNLWEAAARLATLVACVAVVWTPLGLVGVVLAAAGTPLIVRLINGVWFFAREKPWLRPSVGLFDWQLLRNTMADGVFLFLLQIATGLIFHVDKLVIGNRLGVGAVTAYAVLGRVFLIAYSVCALLQGAMWPAYGDAIRRGDRVWVHRTLRRMLVLGVGTMLVCGAFLLLFRGPVVRLLTRGENVVISSHLVVAVSSFFVLRAWAECQSVPLNAAGVVKPQLKILMTNGILNLVFAAILVRPYGVLGVVWSFPLSAALTSLWGYPVLVRRHLGTRVREGPA